MPVKRKKLQSSPRTSTIIRADRLLEVEKKMMQVMADAVICSEIATEYDVSVRSVYRDILAVRDKWHEEAKLEDPTRRSTMRKKLEAFANKAVAAGKFNAAVSAYRLEMELDNLRTLKHEHTGEVSIGIEGKTSADKRSRLEELMAKAKGAEAKVGEKVIH